MTEENSEETEDLTKVSIPDAFSSLAERLNHGEASHWLYKLVNPSVFKDSENGEFVFSYEEIVAKVESQIIKLPAGEITLLSSNILHELSEQKKQQYPDEMYGENLSIDGTNLIISLSKNGLEVEHQPFCKRDATYLFGKRIGALPNEEPKNSTNVLPSSETTANNLFIATCQFTIENSNKIESNGKTSYEYTARNNENKLAEPNKYVFGAVANGKYYLHLEAALKANNEGSVIDTYSIAGQTLKLQEIDSLTNVTINAHHAQLGPSVNYNPENDVHNQWHFDSDMVYDDFPILKMKNLKNVTINDLVTSRVLLKDVQGLKLSLLGEGQNQETQVISMNTSTSGTGENSGVVATQNDLPRKLTVLDTEQAGSYRYTVKENNYDLIAVHARGGKTEIQMPMSAPPPSPPEHANSSIEFSGYMFFNTSERSFENTAATFTIPKNPLLSNAEQKSVVKASVHFYGGSYIDFHPSFKSQFVTSGNFIQTTISHTQNFTQSSTQGTNNRWSYWGPITSSNAWSSTEKAIKYYEKYLHIEFLPYSLENKNDYGGNKTYYGVSLHFQQQSINDPETIKSAEFVGVEPTEYFDSYGEVSYSGTDQRSKSRAVTRRKYSYRNEGGRNIYINKVVLYLG